MNNTSKQKPNLNTACLVLTIVFFFSAFLSAKAFNIRKVEPEDSLAQIELGRMDVEFRKHYRTDLGLALTSAEKAYQVSISIEDTTQIVTWLNRLAVVSKKMSDYDKALEQYRMALNLAYAADNQDLITKIHNNTGNLFNSMGLQDSAMYHLLISLKLKLDANDYTAIPPAYNNIANVLLLNKQPDAAIVYLREGLEILSKHEHLPSRAQLYTALGNCYFQMIRNDSAKYYYLEAQSIYDKLVMKPKLYNVKLNLANVMYAESNYEDAIDYYKDCLIYFNNYKNFRKVISTLNNLGNSFEQIKSFDSAAYYFRKAEHLARQTKANAQLGPIIENLAELEEILGNHERALQYYKERVIIVDSLYQIETAKQIAELQTLYETEKKETENKHLKETNLIEKSRNKQLAITLMISVMFTMAILGIFLQRQKITRVIAQKNEESHRQEINQLIKDHELKSLEAMMAGQEEERKRIAEDLHDRLGSTLSAAKMQIEALGENLDLESNKPYSTTTSLIDQAVEDTRQIAHNMLSGVLSKFGLLAALKDFKETIESANKLTVDINAANLTERLDGEIELNVYRIIQELISNILKHAQASHVSIDLQRDTEKMNVIVADNGIGFDTGRSGNGMGLKNLESRVNKLGGQWAIQSSRENGTKTTIEIPI